MESIRLSDHFIYHRQQQQQPQQQQQQQRQRRVKGVSAAAAVAAVAAAAAAITLLVSTWKDDLPTQVEKLEKKLKEQQYI